jgi:hypothetical protein
MKRVMLILKVNNSLMRIQGEVYHLKLVNEAKIL